MTTSEKNTSKKSAIESLESIVLPEPSEQKQKSTLSKSVFLLPSFMTLASMFSGFYAIIAAMHQQFIHTSVAIFIAMIFDALDGRLARLTNTSTEFGAQLDSIADMVSFGLAPAVLLYVFSLHQWGKVGWLIAFLYAACTGLRLAKFNIAPTDKSYFYGLSTPAAAAVVISFVWLVTKYQLSFFWVHYFIFALTVVLSMLKVSSVPYRSFKDVHLKAKVSILIIFILIILILLVTAYPPIVLFAFFSLYAISGPVFWLLFRARHAKGAAKAE